MLSAKTSTIRVPRSYLAVEYFTIVVDRSRHRALVRVWKRKWSASRLIETKKTLRAYGILFRGVFPS